MVVLSIKTEELIEKMTEEDVIRIMQRLGATEVMDRGDYLSFPTICHNEHESDGGHNLVYYKDTKLFRCFSECAQTYNIFTLVKQRFSNFETDQDTHMSNLFYFVSNYVDNNRFQGVNLEKEDYYPIAGDYEPRALEHKLPIYDRAALDAFYDYFPVEWLSDHISAESMKKYNIKFSHQRNAVVIPHYDVNNRLIGIRQRNLDPITAERYGKYRPLYLEGEVYSHPLAFNLYGLHHVKDNISKHKIAIIAESEKAAMQADTLFGKDNIVTSVCGSSFNRWHLMSLLQNTDVEEIIIAFDQEEKSHSDDRYFNHLWLLCNKYSDYIKMSFVYNTHDIQYKQNIFDLGDKKQTLQLIKDRVRVK